jgi:5-methylcytosine-specific restriction endonuclease McrA
MVGELTDWSYFSITETRSKKTDLTRFNVFLRDNFTCQYCAKKFAANDLTFDHLVPRCLHGKTTWKNVVSACTTCNLKKGRKLIQNTDMKLLTDKSKSKIKKNTVNKKNEIKKRNKK